ncbi:helix-turn-helix domain-containing protein [Arvimicrobium flavum]|uniref:helix-turn-helix domain-containing protein n=1 Tax=Arvimicrobium flavum TaxID=3393320 RepID=UPI00237C1494|nr:helix-turn-helix domain-containing protein [Mesorhizobium shangrilense]
MAAKTPVEGEPRFWHRPTPPDLAGLVTGLYGYAERGTPLAGAVETASLTVPLIINFGTPFRIGLGRQPSAHDRYTSFAAGLFLGPVMMDSDGDAHCIQVNFTPLGGRRFFGMPMTELADRMVPLADLCDPEIDRLSSQIEERNSWESRLDLVEDFVRARLMRGALADPALGWAYRRLLDTHGTVRIGALSGRLEWSRRRLVERFRRDFGLPPKAVARIIRFNAATEMARGSPRPDWADIAAACGYADQAHLTREFAELAGQPPAAWRAAA